MEFQLLGPLEVREGDRVLAIGGAKQRALLAILLLRANEVVSRDRLVEELWPARPPGAAEHSLDHQVSRLRKTLGKPDLLVTRAGGYALQVTPEQIDVNRFERLLEDGRRANADNDPETALVRLEEALALWRGGALADLAYESFARAEIERLEELRLVATEERLDAELALARHATIAPELESLAARHPLRERLRAQEMLALYRSGRQAEALRVFADTRRVLVGELGLEPGTPLQQLEQAILRQDPSLDLARARPRPLRRRRTLLAALAAVGTAGAAAAGLLLAGGGTESSHAQSQAQPDSVVLLSAGSGKVTGQAPVRAPVLSRFGDGALWNVSFAGELTKIDPATGKVDAFRNSGVPIPCGLAVDAGSVWVTDCTSPTLVRIDPAQTVVTDRVALPKTQRGADTGEVVDGAGSLWVAQGMANPAWVDRLDVRTGRLQTRILVPEGGALGGLAFGDGALWVAGNIDDPSVPKLSKVDARTNRIVATVPALPGAARGLAVGGGFVWAATGGAVWKVAETGTIVTSIPLAADAENVTYADDAVWVADGEAGTVVRIDPTTNATRTYRLGHHLIGVAAHDGRVAVGVQPRGEDVTAGLKGRIVNVALKGNYLDWTSTDPAAVQSFNAYQVQFHYATCAKLFNYPDSAGPAGARLVPEVAAGWPAVTDGGRTYRFRIRSGYRFSPPSNQPVTAESFRHEIERVVSPRIPGPWSLRLLSNFVGAAAYHQGRSPHISGVSADGDTLEIRLLRPDADLPRLLARPAFCAVPDDLPIIPDGLPYPLASAGPYYLATRSADVLVLKRNPSYHGPRPHAVDAIVYHMNAAVGPAAARVDRGKVDYVQEVDPVLEPGTAAAGRAGPRYRLTPTDWTEGLALNTRRPLFSDPRLRRAVAYAIDRRALAAAAGSPTGIPTSRVLAPSEPGFADAPGYPLNPSLDLARSLAGRRHAHAVFAVITDDAGVVYDQPFIGRLREQLGAIGIDLTLLPIRQSVVADHPAAFAALLARADLARASATAEQAADPVGYLRQLGEHYLPPADRARLERIDGLASPQREAAVAALAARLDREAVYVQYLNRATPELVSKRLGCVIDQPEYPGLDLAALCLRGS